MHMHYHMEVRMKACCCECEFWEPLPLRQQWGVCSGQDLPQQVGLTGAHVLETEDMAGCELFERSLDDVLGEGFDGKSLGECEEYCFEFLKGEGVL